MVLVLILANEKVLLLLQGGTGSNMMLDSSDAAVAAGAMNMMDEDRVGMFGGRSKRRR